MVTWKKVILWIVGALVAIVGGCAALLDRLGADLCAKTVIDQYTSPSGKLKAVLFQIDCGATTDFNSHVSIVSAGTDITQNSLPQSFFAADGNHGQVPAGKGGGPEVRVFWKADDHLEIQYHNLVRILRAETKSNGVAVEHTTFR